MASTYPPNLPNSNTSRPPNGKRKPDMARLAVRRDPGKLPAAILAVIVHLAFFTLILFGVTWQVKNPLPLSAEIWDSLPPVRNAEPVAQPEPPPPPPPEPEPEPVARKPELAVEKTPPSPSRAEIELKAKRERE